MRLSKINRFLLLLAALFALAVVLKEDLPGEEMLPEVYRATIHRPLLAPMAAAAHGEELKLVELLSEVQAKDLEIRRLKAQLEKTHAVQEYLGALRWEKRPLAVPAWVFMVDADDYRRNFKIDRGQADGLEAGMPVVTGRALLGLIVAIKKDQATVRRVDDPSFQLDVEIQTGDEVVRGLARGDGGDGLDVRYVRRTHSLKPGDVVYTTSYHKWIPAGLVVAEVAEVKDLDQDGIHEVSATPSAALGRWALVHVLKNPERE